MEYKFISVLGGSEIASFKTNDLDAANMLRGALGFENIDDPRTFCGINSGYSISRNSRTTSEADYTIGEIMAGAEALVVALNVEDSARSGLVFLTMTAERMRKQDIALCTIIVY